ncbi:uncharacterized protein LOC133832794 [Humulus lupulus]|uniref:uncharacterized protein LOC133832794 n=1 Tax=Humulus lupulus TaxID=3486 RepID=UPI002B415868|nr:uncharacterized protein LOC133832794 [Humulus lupulus]
MFVHNFYNGFNGTTRTIIDVAAGGDFMSKSTNEAYELLEEMAMNNYQWPTERGQPKKVGGMMELDAILMLTAQVAALTKQLQKTTLPSQAMQVQNLCELCATTHPPNQFPALDMNNMPMEEVQAIGKYLRQPNNPNSISYTPAWKNHPNFSWSNIQNTLQPYLQPQPQYQPAQNRPSYPQQHAHQHPPPGYYQPQNRPQQMPMKPAEPQPDVLNQFMTETMASIRSLETQIGQYEGPNKNQSEEEGQKGNTQGIEEEKFNEEKVTKDLRKEEEVPPVSSEHPVRIPYPQRLHKHNLDNQFAKFLEVFKKLHINIPLTEALEQMPSYVKFMKEILSNKRKMGDYETVALTESLVDRYVKHSHGNIEDVLVKEDKFIFPADFIVLDIEEDENVPIILGRPFLTTGQALLDVQKGEGEEVVFNVLKAMTYPKGSDNCFSIDVVEEVVGRKKLIKDPLELSLTVNDVDDEDNEEALSYLKWIQYI